MLCVEKGERVMNTEGDVCVVKGELTTLKALIGLQSKSEMACDAFHYFEKEVNGRTVSFLAVFIVDALLGNDLSDICDDFMSLLDEDEDREGKEKTMKSKSTVALPKMHEMTPASGRSKGNTVRNKISQQMEISTFRILDALVAGDHHET